MATPTTFVLQTELKYSISQTIVDKILVGTAGAEIFAELEKDAESMMKGYLREKFDVDVVFDVSSGVAFDQRNRTLTKICRDIIIYRMFMLYNFREIPVMRIKNYDDGLQWLKDVRDEKIIPDFALDDDMTYVKSGSNDKLDNYQN